MQFTFFLRFVSGSDGEGRSRGSRAGLLETVNITMEVAQLLLSLIHAWGLDPDLDKVCEGKLGLLRPMLPVSFGIMSKGGKLFVLVFISQARWTVSNFRFSHKVNVILSNRSYIFLNFV